MASTRLHDAGDRNSRARRVADAKPVETLRAAMSGASVDALLDLAVTVEAEHVATELRDTAGWLTTLRGVPLRGTVGLEHRRPVVMQCVQMSAKLEGRRVAGARSTRQRS